ncbi:MULTISPECIES: GLPGLI family protein [unclassified Proteiniphilum]|jgi:GLPGLI family protein|uniref:GLPGLI family protein n=1 Tax=unclassified Proteiniphilum TaxID=2622718 RepID=UPI00257DF726|nr:MULTISPECIES: GLPGLI family protein [unclassified Proteiniphilum]
MEKIILSFIVFILFVEVHAQTIQIDNDSANIRITYSFIQNNPKEEALSRADTMALDIGEKLSSFYDLTASAKNNMISDAMSTGEIDFVVLVQNPKDINDLLLDIEKKKTFNSDNHIPFTIFKNRVNNMVYTQCQNLGVSSISVFLKEDLAPQTWSIEGDTCRILDYLCQKAITEFRGRTYEAYFTMDIPINEGPWKLYGLPGLILEANTTDGLFRFCAMGIEKIKDKQINISYDKKTEVCKDLKQYQDIVKSQKKVIRIQEKTNLYYIEIAQSKNIIPLEIGQ